MTDVNIKDKMKFGPTLKWINPRTISYLKSNVAESAGTALFLDVMRLMYRSLIEDDIPPIARIHDLWYVDAECIDFFLTKNCTRLNTKC